MQFQCNFKGTCCELILKQPGSGRNPRAFKHVQSCGVRHILLLSVSDFSSLNSFFDPLQSFANTSVTHTWMQPPRCTCCSRNHVDPETGAEIACDRKLVSWFGLEDLLPVLQIVCVHNMCAALVLPRRDRCYAILHHPKCNYKLHTHLFGISSHSDS